MHTAGKEQENHKNIKGHAKISIQNAEHNTKHNEITSMNRQMKQEWHMSNAIQLTRPACYIKTKSLRTVTHSPKEYNQHIKKT
jgi:hypothetical protein